jgi:hypothetical protein
MTWFPSVSDQGRLALSRYDWMIHLWEVPLELATGGPLGPPRRLTHDDAPKFSFSLSRDGDLLAYSAYSGPRDARRVEVRLLDSATGQETVPVALPGDLIALYPHLSPDGSLLTWRRFVDGHWVDFIARTGGPGRELCKDCAVTDFFANGREVLVARDNALIRMDVEGGQESTLLEVHDRVLFDARLSWDDSALAVLTGEPAERDFVINVVPLREGPTPPEEWIRIAGGDEWVAAPRWSPDGRLLYYLSNRDDFICVWARALDSTTLRPTGEPMAIVHAHDAEKRMLTLKREVWSLAVGADRLIFNAALSRGNVYTAQLPPVD